MAVAQHGVDDVVVRREGAAVPLQVSGVDAHRFVARSAKGARHQLGVSEQKGLVDVHERHPGPPRRKRAGHQRPSGLDQAGRVLEPGLEPFDLREAGGHRVDQPLARGVAGLHLEKAQPGAIGLTEGVEAARAQARQAHRLAVDQVFEAGRHGHRGVPPLRAGDSQQR